MNHRPRRVITPPSRYGNAIDTEATAALDRRLSKQLRVVREPVLVLHNFLADFDKIKELRYMAACIEFERSKLLNRDARNSHLNQLRLVKRTVSAPMSKFTRALFLPG